MSSIDLPWELTLLGRTELRDHDGLIVTTRTRKTMLVLAVLALAGGHEVFRSELAQTVWPDVPLKAAQESLRTALASLRKVLPPHSIGTRDDVVWLKSEAVLCDANHPAEHEKYVGEFMPGFDSDWVVDQRLRIRSAFVCSAVGAAKGAWAGGQRHEALDLLTKANRIDPMDQEVVALHVEWLQELGRTSTAVQVSDAYRARVLKDLGVVSDVRPKPLAATDHPLVTAVEWLLDRDPDEACSMLASTQSRWMGIAVEQALGIHERALLASRKESPARTMVESQRAYLLVLSGKLGPVIKEVEQAQKKALSEGAYEAASRLGAALAYGYLSKVTMRGRSGMRAVS